MNAVVQHPASVPGSYAPAQLALIRRTVASDCNNDEFDLFVTVARNAGLDPFRKQISALVFNKAKPDKRRMAIVTTIDGLRTIAARSGKYRPDEDEPQFVVDEAAKGDTNPSGLIKAVVRIRIMDTRGEWFPVAGSAEWAEFAPLSEEWKEGEDGRRRPTGKKTLDTGGNWGRMPRIMLAKCAEAQALRKAFPEDLSGLYEGAEFDQAKAVELTPSEIVEATAAQDRLVRIGGAGTILFQLFPNAPLEALPLGQVFDRVDAAVAEFSSLEQIRWFESANLQPMREFWARAPGDGLELKKRVEKRRGELERDAEAAA